VQIGAAMGSGPYRENLLRLNETTGDYKLLAKEFKGIMG